MPTSFRRPAPTALAIAFVAAGFAPQAALAQYRQPPSPIATILDKPGTPQVQVSPDGTRLLLLQRPTMPSIAEVAAPEYRIAGIRFDPANNGPSRRFGATGLSLQPVSGGASRTIAMSLPPKSSIGNVSWSSNGQRIAFTVSSPDAITLWLADATAGTAKQLTPRALNAVLNTPCSWASASQLVCAFVPEGRGAAPVAPTTPDGPITQEALSGSTDRAATYQDLLKTPFDEKTFEYYGTSQLALVSTDGTLRPLGKAGMHSSARVSPDGRFVLVNTLSRPFSYTVPWSYFPTRTEVWSLDGTPVKTVTARPLVEKVPWGGNGALTGPRNVTWRSDADATLVWTEALDGGDQNAKAPKRDKVVALAAPFTAAPTTVLETEYRAGDILWATPSMAIATETDGKTLRTRTWIINPAGGSAPRLLWDRSAEDRYGNPGTFLTTRDARGQTVLRTTPDGRSAFLVSEGASAEGDRPFVDKFDLASAKSTRLFRSQAPYYESVVDVLDAAGNVVLTRRESKTDAPNYYARDLVRRIAPRALTTFADPAPQFAGMTSQLISYTRKDGVKLSATIHLPAGYDKTRDGPLPFLLWAYPLEFRSQDAASQVVGSPNRFVRPNGDSHLFLLTQGYGVMDNPTMPIVGMDGKEPNDTYVEQLTASAQAAVDTIVAMGVADRERIGVGGHSYGAFMTANLLAHTRLFKAGVARSGAYNRTLTPFGFQGEERSYWEAPELYERMSPFTYANRIKDPILLIHGMADNNTGTYPIQSERMYQALKGHGATVRYVQLPAESHGYSARESVGHSLSEMVTWLDQYVKTKKKAAM
ncbi:MAG TPA: prolyl oligopeptidase family serine peptidase [Gemmatimonas sp.]|nr:prolyl oligopeptidase family serine peptidase [Gemmatimonas sp.]